MDSDLVKAFVCLGLAGVLMTSPVWVPMWAKAAAVEAEAEVQYEDEFCSGATPDCPSHWEAWNSLQPTMD